MDEIIPNLWLGNIHEVLNQWQEFDTIVTVLHLSELSRFELEDYKAIKLPNLINIPILKQSYQWNELLKDYTPKDTWVDPVAMNMMAVCILTALHADKNKVLVVCAASQERSPLAVVWYLYCYSLDWCTKTLQETFEFVKSKHPQTLDRLSWLNKCIPNEV